MPEVTGFNVEIGTQAALASSKGLRKELTQLSKEAARTQKVLRAAATGISFVNASRSMTAFSTRIRRADAEVIKLTKSWQNLLKVIHATATEAERLRNATKGTRVPAAPAAAVAAVAPVPAPVAAPPARQRLNPQPIAAANAVNTAAGVLGAAGVTGRAAAAGINAAGVAATRSAASVAKFSNQIKGADVSMTRLRTSTVSATAALASLGIGIGFVALIDNLKEFEKRMSQVKAVVTDFASTSATSAEALELRFFSLTKAARQLGRTTIFSAKEVAEGMRLLALAGFTATETIEAIPGVLAGAVAGNLDLAEATDYTTSILRQFNLQAAEASRVADILALTASASNTDVKELGEAFKFVGPAALNVNQSVQDVAAALGVLSNAGLKASIAGTALRRILVGLTEIQNVGNLQKFGIEIAKVDPRFNRLVDIFKEFKRAGLDLTKAVTLFEQRGGPAALALTVLSESLEDLTEKTNNAAGVAEKMAEVMRDNLAGDLKLLEGNIIEATLLLGERGLTKVLREVTQTATDAIQALTGLKSPLEDGSEAGFKLAAGFEAVGIALLAFAGGRVFTRFIQFMGSLYHAATRLGQAMRLLPSGFLLFSRALVNVPFGPFATAASLAIAAFAFFGRETNKIALEIEHVNGILAESNKQLELMRQAPQDVQIEAVPGLKQDATRIQQELDRIDAEIQKVIDAKTHFEERIAKLEEIPKHLKLTSRGQVTRDLDDARDRLAALNEEEAALIEQGARLERQFREVAGSVRDITLEAQKTEKREGLLQQIFGEINQPVSKELTDLVEKTTKAVADARFELDQLRRGAGESPAQIIQNQIEEGLRKGGFDEEALALIKSITDEIGILQDRLGSEKLKLDAFIGPDEDKRIAGERIKAIELQIDAREKALQVLDENRGALHRYNEELGETIVREKGLKSLYDDMKKVFESNLTVRDKMIVHIAKLERGEEALRRVIAKEAPELDAVATATAVLAKERAKALAEVTRAEQQESQRLAEAKAEATRLSLDPIRRGLFDFTQDLGSFTDRVSGFVTDMAQNLSDTLVGIISEPKTALQQLKEFAAGVLQEIARKAVVEPAIEFGASLLGVSAVRAPDATSAQAVIILDAIKIEQSTHTSMFATMNSQLAAQTAALQALVAKAGATTGESTEVVTGGVETTGKSLGEDIILQLSEVYESVRDTIIQALGGMKNTLLDLFSQIPSVLSGAFQGLMSAVAALGKAVIQLIIKAATYVIGFFGQGGLVNKPAATVALAASVFAAAPAFAGGGMVRGARPVPIIAHEDEAVVPAKNGRIPIISRNGKLMVALPGGRTLPTTTENIQQFASGGMVGGRGASSSLGGISNVKINFENTTGVNFEAEEKSREQVGDTLVITGVIKKVVSEDLQKNGSITRTLDRRKLIRNRLKSR